jgi:hypothetical protein
MEWLAGLVDAANASLDAGRSTNDAYFDDLGHTRPV